MAEQMTALAEKYYPAALLYLGEREEARAAVTEALAAMQRKQLTDALPILMRICWEREIGLIPNPKLFPQDSLLAAVMKLPAEGRREIGLRCIGVSAAEAAEACGITEEEHARSFEKATRQLIFLCGGEAPSAETLREAVCGIALTEKEKDAVQRGLARAEREYEENQKILAAYKEGRAVRHIVRTRKSGTGRKFTVFDTVLCCICVILAAAVAVLLLERHSAGGSGFGGTSAGDDLTVVRFDGMDMDAAKEAALKDAGIAAAEALFVGSKLDLTAEPRVYHMDFQSGGMRYEYKLDAKTGEVLAKKSAEEDAPLDAAVFAHTAELRKTARSVTGAEDAILIREKLGQDDEPAAYWCKFDFIDSAGRVYYLEFDPATMAMTKFDVEWDPASVTSDVIYADEARRCALREAGGVSAEQVIFTKTKREGAVYRVAFTLADGTQYTVELDAQNGSTRNVDTRKPPEDLGETVGLFPARDAALREAGVEASAVRFTKAKIDTKKGAYVYEFSFETKDTGYEAVLDAKTAEILKFRAS